MLGTLAGIKLSGGSCLLMLNCAGQVLVVLAALTKNLLFLSAGIGLVLAPAAVYIVTPQQTL